MELSLKNLLLAGIGTMAYTYERGADVIQEMIQKGEITLSQGKELTAELKRRVEGNVLSPAMVAAPSADAIREALAGMNLATRTDIEELKERISRLEQK